MLLQLAAQPQARPRPARGLPRGPAARLAVHVRVPAHLLVRRRGLHAPARARRLAVRRGVGRACRARCGDRRLRLLPAAQAALRRARPGAPAVAGRANSIATAATSTWSSSTRRTPAARWRPSACSPPDAATTHAPPRRATCSPGRICGYRGESMQSFAALLDAILAAGAAESAHVAPARARMASQQSRTTGRTTCSTKSSSRSSKPQDHPRHQAGSRAGRHGGEAARGGALGADAASTCSRSSCWWWTTPDSARRSGASSTTTRTPTSSPSRRRGRRGRARPGPSRRTARGAARRRR